MNNQNQNSHLTAIERTSLSYPLYEVFYRTEMLCDGLPTSQQYLSDFTLKQ